MLVPVAFIAVISFLFCSSPMVVSTASSTLSGVMHVDHRRRNVEQVLAHHEHRNVIAHDVAEQLKEGEHQGEQDE